MKMKISVTIESTFKIFNKFRKHCLNSSYQHQQIYIWATEPFKNLKFFWIYGIIFVDLCLPPALHLSSICSISWLTLFCSSRLELTEWSRDWSSCLDRNSSFSRAARGRRRSSSSSGTEAAGAPRDICRLVFWQSLFISSSLLSISELRREIFSK